MPIKIVADLRPQFAQIRNQGQRPTCMAFAASDSHAFARGIREPLSVEYAFFNAVRRKTVPDPNSGVPFSAISAAIEIDGQPAETAWPYDPRPVNKGKWKPPDKISELFYRKSSTSDVAIDRICTDLDAGKPTMVMMDVSYSFFKAAAGNVLGPAIEPRINTHAVIAVGHGIDDGKRCILIRNSWGERWADQGYAWLEERYLAPRVLQLGTMH